MIPFTPSPSTTPTAPFKVGDTIFWASSGNPVGTVEEVVANWCGFPNNWRAKISGVTGTCFLTSDNIKSGTYTVGPPVKRPKTIPPECPFHVGQRIFRYDTKVSKWIYIGHVTNLGVSPTTEALFWVKTNFNDHTTSLEMSRQWTSIGRYLHK